MVLTDICKMALFPNERLIDTETALIIFTPVIPYALNVPFLTQAEKEYIASLGNSRRRDESAAWRGALRRVTQCAETAYSPAGAPYLIGSDLQIGVSHTSSLAAVIVSQQRCAIDLELKNRNFSRASTRYISSAESIIPHNCGDLWPAVVWCAKEALYKFTGLPGVDLLEDIHITGIDTVQGTISGVVRNMEGVWQNHLLNLLTDEEFVCVWITEQTPCLKWK